LVPPCNLRRAAAAGFVLAFLTSEAVPAQQLAPRYDVSPAVTVVALSGLTGAWAAAHWLKPQLPHATCGPCDPAGLLFFDRAVIGPTRRRYGLASDVTLVTAVAGATAALLSSGGSGDARREDLAVWAQAVTLTSAATAWGKVLFHRPRPNRYATDLEGRPVNPDDGLSFPSGHASVAAAAAVAFASIQHHRGSARDQRGTATVLISAATATAVLRVAARRHFPTDVAGGALLGGLIGWFVPAAYPMR
jgi:membrane-associated phospholipid phosphatase